ncbi:hypothetical protein NC981_01045 [Leptolyngbya sp. DQ-M1]|uniref:hypothetical protein n=1 Tax=Leptolyngbya sp. DQ-M1 TaxID=2933920 RepID=UPI00329A4AC5
MRGWFETLDYRFEPYEQWQADGFEWIINIPVRCEKYDCILVRGIEGEAELRDVLFQVLKRGRIQRLKLRVDCRM